MTLSYSAQPLPGDELAIMHAIRIICELKTTGALVFKNERDFEKVFGGEEPQIIVQSYPRVYDYADQELLRKDLATICNSPGRRYREVEDVLGPVSIFPKKEDLRWQPVTLNPTYVIVEGAKKLVIDVPNTTLSIIRCARQEELASVFEQCVQRAKIRKWQVPLVFFVPQGKPPQQLLKCATHGSAAWASDFLGSRVAFLRQQPPADGLARYSSLSVLIANDLWRELHIL